MRRIGCASVFWNTFIYQIVPVDKDVGDVGVAELEEPVDRPGTTIVVRRVAFYSSAIFDETWFLTTGP